MKDTAIHPIFKRHSIGGIHDLLNSPLVFWPRGKNALLNCLQSVFATIFRASHRCIWQQCELVHTYVFVLPATEQVTEPVEPALAGFFGQRYNQICVRWDSLSLVTCM